MIEIIFTNRPVSWRPMSWVNAITRMKTRSPFDHVTIKYGLTIYESAAPGGVRKENFVSWAEKRKGSFLTIYEIPRFMVDFNVFDDLKGKKYDYPANVYFLFGLTKMLKKRKNKRIYCSELVGKMLHYPDAHELTPDELWERLRRYKCRVEKIKE